MTTQFRAPSSQLSALSSFSSSPCRAIARSATAGLSLCLALALSLPSLLAGIEVVRGELFARAMAMAEADSNIYFNSDQTGDYVFTVAPELVFTRRAGLTQVDANAGIRVQRFLDEDQNDDENPFASAVFSWAPPGGKSDGKLLLSAVQETGANPDINEGTTVDTYKIDGAFGHFVSEKLGYRVQSGYTIEDYGDSRAGLSDLREFQAGLDARYKYSPKLESYLRYKFRDTSYENGVPGAPSIDSQDHQGWLGFDGELYPKVKGKLEVGYGTRQFEVSNKSQSAFLYDVALAWKWSAATSFSLIGKRDYDASAADQSVLRSSFGVEAVKQVGPKIGLWGAIKYSDDAYSGGAVPRTDNTWTFDSRCDYFFTPSVLGRIQALYSTVDSNSAFATYDRALLALSVGVRF